ncbi:MAG TPA: lamin tail domain-containing protein, partial [Phycisphaerae bacterium]|nr:lamin tail domain-containing protein [Phycisphaerae bacterium]
TSTVQGFTDIAIQSHNKYGVTSGTIIYNVTNSILVATDPIDAQAPYVESDIHVDYTNVFDEAWTGTGNLQLDAMFVNPALHDYQLQPGSPCIDAGDPADPTDPDGSRTDMGYFSGGTVAPDVTVTIEATDPDAAEQGADTGTFTITRTGDTTDPLTVYYTVSGTAEDTDYDEGPLPGQVEIAAGSPTATITITPEDDPNFELDETVVLTLTGNPSYAVGAASSALVMIADNDQTSGSLTEDTVWTAAGGPYLVTAELTVPAGISLTIAEGTTVFFAPGARLIVRGLLQADGTEYRPIRFTRLPGSGATWGGIQFDNTMQDNRITYAILEYGRTDNGMIGLDNSNLLVDHATFDHTDYRRIRTEGSALVVRNSIFTDVLGPGQAPTWDNHNEHIWGTAGAGLVFLIENNRFGTTKGHSDAIDVNGANGMRLQILNNVFMGGGDDALDLEGDAHIEGNVFMHFHKDQWNTGSGNANAISAGAGKQYVMVRNVFSDLDHAAQVKDDAFLTFVNNTVYDLDYAAIYFLRPGQPGSYGDGAYVDGNIFWDVPVTFADVTVDIDLTVNRSIVDAAWHGYGTGNLEADPRLADPAGGDFSLLPGSPAIGAGALGLDMGYDVAAGAAIRTDVPALTYLADATFDVGGPGIVAYQYQLDGGGWSAEQTVGTPIVLSGLGDAQDHTLEVIGKSSAGAWQEAADAASNVWHVDTAHRQLLINEVLADNDAAAGVGGYYPDIIELYYDAPAGAADFDLEGYILSDGPNEFTFAAGAVVPAGGYLVLYADDDPGGVPGTWLGFGLQAEGDDVWLYEPDGLTVVDSVAFGPQVADLAIGRVGPTRAWALAQPTVGAANVAARTGRQDTLVINEWFANGDVAFVDDFVELYNPDTLPVSLDGLYLTDNPVSQRAKAPLGPLSFAAADGYAVFRADDSASGGHVGFRLTADEGMIGLYDAQGTPLDRILYIPQTTDVSQGRVPDSGDVWDLFPIPTPGVANPNVVAGQTVVDTLVSAGDAATYHVPTAGEDVLAWTAPTYDDGSWTSEVHVDLAGLVITEIETGDTDWVEIQNVSGAEVAAAGWVVLVNDPSGGSINGVLATAWDLPASVAAGEVLYRTDDTGEDYWGADIPWDAGGSGWAIILDDTGIVADFLAWGYTQAEIASLSVDYGAFTGITVGDAWSGDGAEVGDGSGGGVPGPEENVFDFGATWDYLNPTNGTDPATTDPDFHTTWMLAPGAGGPAFPGSGAGILGYGTIDYGPVVTNIVQPASGSRYTAYFRREFTLTGDMVNVGLEILSDDGGVIYIDGVEATRNNFSGADTYLAFADGYTYPNGDNTERVTRTLSIADLGAGTHTIAVSMHQSSATSSDIGLDLRLFGQPDGGLGTALERSGSTDHNTAADFAATGTPTPGSQNAGLTVPFGATTPVVTGLGFSGGHFAGHVATDVADAMLGTNASLWTRIAFQAADPSAYNNLTLRVQYDDGFVAYLNGVRIAGRNAPASLAWDSAATGEHPDGEAVLFERIDVSAYLDALVVGDNVLAIHGLNLGASDADFLISAELEAATSPFEPNLLGALNGLRVSEIMYHHPAGTDFDFLELVNAGTEEIDLSGIRIDGGVQYTFAGGTLAPGEYVVVVDDVGAFEAWYGSGINVAGQYGGSLSNGGEEIILRLSEPYDAAVLRFDYDDSWFGTQTDGDGLSLVILDASRRRRSWDERWSWRPSSDVNGSPGGEDRVPDYPLGSIIINEVLAHQDLVTGDWIEIYNNWDQAVDLDGWFLSDASADLMKFEITPAAVGDTVLQPGEYMVFTEAQHFGEFATDPGNHTWFALSEHGDQVWLSSGSGGVLGTYRETLAFDASDNGISLGRYTTSTDDVHFVALSARTSGYVNAYPNVGPVVISELMYHPVDGTDEFIELYNITSADVPLYDPANPDNTWTFTNGVTFTFPTGVTLGAGEYLLVTGTEPALFRTEFGIDPSVQIYGPFEDGTALANGGETVELSKPSAPDPGTGFVSYIVVDRVEYSDGSAVGDPWPTDPDGNGPSLERVTLGEYGDDPVNWTASPAADGSPGQDNSTAPARVTGVALNPH